MSDVQIPLLSTPTQAAQIIGISPRKFRDLIAARRITVKMLDGRIRVPRDAILSFCGEHSGRLSGRPAPARVTRTSESR